MKQRGEADVALLQEAGSPPGELADLIAYQNDVFWNHGLYDRWCLVLPLSDRIAVQSLRQVPPLSEVGEDDTGVSGIETTAAAKISLCEVPESCFIAVSMYARWMKPHPLARSAWRVGMADTPAHRIISDLSAFIGHRDPVKRRILAAGDLNMSFEVVGDKLSIPEREQTVWDRMPAGCRKISWMQRLTVKMYRHFIRQHKTPGRQAARWIMCLPREDCMKKQACLRLTALRRGVQVITAGSKLTLTWNRRRTQNH